MGFSYRHFDLHTNGYLEKKKKNLGYLLQILGYLVQILGARAQVVGGSYTSLGTANKLTGFSHIYVYAISCITMTHVP